MAGILSDDYAALKKLQDISGAITLEDAVRKGYMSNFTPKKEQLDHTCSRCARLEMPERDPEATASECGCPVNFSGLKYCFRHAYAKRLCRRCGSLLPPPPRKSKKKQKTCR